MDRSARQTRETARAGRIESGCKMEITPTHIHPPGTHPLSNRGSLLSIPSISKSNRGADLVPEKIKTIREIHSAKQSTYAQLVRRPARQTAIPSRSILWPSCVTVRSILDLGLSALSCPAPYELHPLSRDSDCSSTSLQKKGIHQHKTRQLSLAQHVHAS